MVSAASSREEDDEGDRFMVGLEEFVAPVDLWPLLFVVSRCLSIDDMVEINE